MYGKCQDAKRASPSPPFQTWWFRLSPQKIYVWKDLVPIPEKRKDLIFEKKKKIENPSPLIRFLFGEARRREDDDDV